MHGTLLQMSEKKNKQHMLLIFISINKHKNQNYSYLQLLPSIFVGNPLFSVSKKKENTNFQVHFYDWNCKKTFLTSCKFIISYLRSLKSGKLNISPSRFHLILTGRPLPGPLKLASHDNMAGLFLTTTTSSGSSKNLKSLKLCSDVRIEPKN